MEMSINIAGTVLDEVSNDEENGEQKVDPVNLSRMDERESKSVEENSEAVNIADLEFDMLHSNVDLYNEKSVPSPLKEYFIFID